MSGISIFIHHIFNCDPHPGNYIFPGPSKVAFLDFGCVKRFKPKMMKTWKKMMVDFFEGNREAFIQDLKDAGFIEQDASKEMEDYLIQMYAFLFEPNYIEGEFHYKKDRIKESWNWIYKDNPYKFDLNLPKDWTFVNRLQWGMWAVLAELDTKFAHKERVCDLLKIDPNKKYPGLS